MAVVSRTAKAVVSNGVASSSYTVTADVQDQAAGGLVTLALSGLFGVGGPNDPTSITVTAYTSAGATIRTYSVTLTDFSNGATRTLYLTHNGTSTGVKRSGTVEIAIRVTRSGTGLNDYDVETDGSPNSVPAGWSVTTLDRGWVRSTTTGVSALSNAALGGAKAEPAEYGESVYHRLTLDAQPYDSQTIALGISSSLSGSAAANASSSTTTFDATLAAVVDDRLGAGAQTLTSTAVPAGNAGRSGFTTGQPWTVLTAHTTDALTADPRLTASEHLFQVDDNVFATPPMASHVASKQMTLDQIAYLAVRFTKSRTAAGVDGLTVVQANTPRKSGSAKSAASTTATRGGEAGWTDLLVWDSIKPGGIWDWTVDVTSPAAIDSDAHLLNGADTVELLAPANPDIKPLVRGGSLGRPGGHAVPGDAVTIGLALRHWKTGVYLTPDADPAPSMRVLRINAALGRGEFLDADMAWKPTQAAGVPVAAHAWPLAPSPGDPFLYLHTFSGADTAGWGHYNVSLEALAYYDGTLYPGEGEVEMVGAYSDHSAIDPYHLAL